MSKRAIEGNGGSTRAARRTPRAILKAASCYGVEALEPRAMLSVGTGAIRNFQEPGSTVSLTGSGFDDVYVVARDGSHLTIDETLGSGATTHYVYDDSAVTALLINTSVGNDQVIIDATAGALNANVTYDGGEPSSTPGDRLVVKGGGLDGSYLPSSSTADGGVVTIGTQRMSFTHLESIGISAFSNFTMQTPNSRDMLSISSILDGNVITGSSGATAIAPLTWSAVNHFVLDTGLNDGKDSGWKDDVVTISGFQGLTVPAGGTFLLKGGGGFDQLNVYAGTFTFDEDAKLYTENLFVAAWNSTIHFNSIQHLEGIDLRFGARADVTLGGSRLLFAISLNVDDQSTLELNDNPLLVYSAVTLDTDIRAMILRAYADGAWTGKGITCSFAAADPSKYTIGFAYGYTYSTRAARPDVVPGEILVRPSLVGDANMDGKVDFDDIVQTLGYVYNVGPFSSYSYTDGDLNYDQEVDFSDLSLVLSANYNSGNVFPNPPILSAEAAALQVGAASARVQEDALTRSSHPAPVATPVATSAKRRKWHPW